MGFDKSLAKNKSPKIIIGLPLKWFTHTDDSLGTSSCLNIQFFHITIDCLYFLFNINLPPYNKNKTKLSFFFLFWWKKRKLCLNFTPTQKKNTSTTWNETSNICCCFCYDVDVSPPLQTFRPHSSCCGHKV